jgi:DNA-binding transcriptional LysR family regulator
MEIRQLRTFLAVARNLHFTRAAQRLNLSQSTVSAQVRELEEELGVRLFDRLGRTVLLTEAGQRLVEYARRMNEMAEEIRGEVGRLDDTQGSLCVRVPATLATVYLPEVVERFHAALPGVRLEFIHCDDARLRQELGSGRIDLAFLLTENLTMEGVNVRFLRSEPLALAAAPGHELAGADCVAPKDLDGRTVLRPRTD